ncbi:MAG TPA: hypothetical protein PKI19_08275 [Elusimicrobiales bacterium]|nr:hypothetical protein [Elusimicrobiales bacterium]
MKTTPAADGSEKTGRQAAACGKPHGGWRAANITLRTVHILSFSVLLGGHWFNAPRGELVAWLYWTVFSGAGLLALDLRGGFDWLRRLAGSLVLAKLAVIGLVPLFWEQRLWLLGLALAIGCVGSHMPGALRHLPLFPGSAGPEEEGS